MKSRIQGIAIAKVKKPYKGRKSALNEVGVAKLKQMEAAGSSKIKIVETLGISRASVYSYLNACLISKRKLFNRPKAVVFKRLLSVTSRDNP